MTAEMLHQLLMSDALGTALFTAAGCVIVLIPILAVAALVWWRM